MGEVIHREVKFITTQRVLPDEPYVDNIYPIREWSVNVLYDDNGTLVPPPFIERVTFKLHESFANPNKVLKKPPFKIIEEGWGEFEMSVVLNYIDNGGSQSFSHDLNFQTGESYEKVHRLTFKNPKPGLLRALNTKKRASDGVVVGTKKKKRAVDIDRLADGLTRMNEDNLLQVVQLVNDQKTDEMYVRNDLEEGEFHIDLHTLSDTLLLDLQRLVDAQ